MVVGGEGSERSERFRPRPWTEGHRCTQESKRGPVPGTPRSTSVLVRHTRLAIPRLPTVEPLPASDLVRRTADFGNPQVTPDRSADTVRLGRDLGR